MKIESQIYYLDKWKTPEKWPNLSSFYVAVISDGVELNSAGYDELILGAVQSGACSIYFWGTQSDRAADAAVFSIVEFEVIGKVKMQKCEGFLALPIHKKAAKDAVDLIIKSYIPYANVNATSPILVVCGLKNSKSMKKFCRALEQSEDPQ